MAQQPPLLRDVIDIKKSISTSDSVLSLAEATTSGGARNALADYVVTERLLENFDEAPALIKSSLDGHRSKAAYLHRQPAASAREPHTGRLARDPRRRR
jgi:hypothetical protein